MKLTDEQAELAAGIAAVAPSWSRLEEAGLFDVLVPADRGGLGLEVADAVGIFYELGRNPVPGPVLENVLLRPLFGRHPGVVALADPAATGRSAVSLVDDRLVGRVDLVHAAADVESFVVLVDRRAFVVPRTAASVGEPFALDLTSPVASIGFDLAVGGLTEIDLDDPESLRANLRLLTAAQVAGAGRALLDMSVAYALVREQFGRAIGSFQALQHILAETYEYVAALESLVEWAASAEPGNAVEAAARAKAGSARFGRMIAENALQVHGGIGFTAEHALGTYYRLILGLEARYGDSRTLSEAIGRRLLASAVA